MRAAEAFPLSYCANCGAQVSADARFCASCGAPRAVSPPAPPAQVPTYGPMPGEKNPLLALLLSIVTGLGQLYNGETAKGIALLVVGIVLFALTVVTFVLCVVSVPFWIFGMYDAYERANAYNLALRTTGRPPW